MSPERHCGSRCPPGGSAGSSGLSECASSIPKSLQCGKVCRQLSPCRFPGPAQLKRKDGSERRPDPGTARDPSPVLPRWRYPGRGSPGSSAGRLCSSCAQPQLDMA